MSEAIEQWKAQLMTLPQEDRAELAHFLLVVWNSDDIGQDDHIHGKFERAQPWAKHLHR